jgi:hypothetical protein
MAQGQTTYYGLAIPRDQPTRRLREIIPLEFFRFIGSVYDYWEETLRPEAASHGICDFPFGELCA